MSEAFETPIVFYQTSRSKKCTQLTRRFQIFLRFYNLIWFFLHSFFSIKQWSLKHPIWKFYKIYKLEIKKTQWLIRVFGKPMCFFSVIFCNYWVPRNSWCNCIRLFEIFCKLKICNKFVCTKFFSEPLFSKVGMTFLQSCHVFYIFLSWL